jgi:hypothetical protein
MWDRRDSYVALALSLLALSVFLTYWDYGINDDEGYLLGGVSRVLAGEVLYRDFHHTYAPGNFYLVALLFRVFGEDLLVLRALWLALRVAIVFLAYAAGRRLLGRPAAAAAALLFIAAPGPWHKSFFHFFLLANALVLALLPGRGRRFVFVAGALAGATFLFRQDLAIFVGLLYALLLLAGRWSGETPRRAAAFLLGAAIPVLPFAAYFAKEGALGKAFAKILFSGLGDNRTNELPFPPLLAPVAGVSGLAFLFLRLLYYAPVPLCLAALLRALPGFFRRSAAAFPLLVFSFLGLLSFHQVLWRSDLPHLFQALGAFYLLLPWAVHAAARGRARLGALLVLALPVLAHLSLASYATAFRSPAGVVRIAAEGFQPVPPYYTGSWVQADGESVRLPIPKARVRTTPDEARFLTDVEAVLDRYSSPGDFVLAIPGFQMIYFLFDRVNPTRYVHLRRGFDSEEEEARYVRDLLDRPTRLVLFRDVPLDGREERRVRTFAPRVAEAIDREFTPVDRVGDLVAYARKGAGR